MKKHSTKISFYCPVDVHLFPGMAVSEVTQDDELSESREPWEAALVKNPQDYAVMLDQALQNYNYGNMRLDYDVGGQLIKPDLTNAHCEIIGRDNSLWLEVECDMGEELSRQEINQLQKRVAGSISGESTIARWPDQWGWLNTDAGALIIRPQPVEDWSFSTNGYQPRFEDLTEDNHLLTESEWLSGTESHQPDQNDEHDEYDMKLEEQRRISANKARLAADMPECIRLLSALEGELQGEKGQIGEWMRISYELNEDFEVAPAEMVQEICDAFRKVNHQYGNHIACALYASQSVVLPCEIVHAADYLSMGGKFQDIGDLASSGIFMGDYDLLGYDLKTELVTLVHGGGTEADIYLLINSQGHRQAADQSDSGSPTLGQH